MRTSSERLRFLVQGLLLFPLIVVAAGCGSKEGSLSGKVTYKGKPVTGGEIQFYPDNKSGPFPTQIGMDGTYSISKVPPGPAKVTIMTMAPTPPMGMMGGRGAAKAKEGMTKGRDMLKGKGQNEGKASSEAPAERVTVPEKYADPEKTDLKVDIKGGKQEHNINLE